MPRESTIRILRSDTAAAVPSLTAGEIAVNIPDQRLFVGNSTGGVIPFYGNGVSGINGITGGVSITSGSGITITQTGKQITVASSITQYTAPLATSSVTGVASFPNTDFSVSTAGAVSLTGNVARTHIGQTFTGLQVFSNGISANGLTGTLLTPAQPNITSVGTLTSLNTAGMTSTQRVNVSAGGIVVQAGGLSVTGAAVITGSATVYGDIEIYDGAFVRTGGLSVTGGIAGTLLTSTQPNVTQVGSLVSLTSAGATFSQRVNITNGGLSAGGGIIVQSGGIGVTGGMHVTGGANIYGVVALGASGGTAPMAGGFGNGNLTARDLLHISGNLSIYGESPSFSGATSQYFFVRSSHSNGNIVGYHRYNISYWGSTIATWVGNGGGYSMLQNANVIGTHEDNTAAPNFNTHTSFNVTDDYPRSAAVIYIGSGSSGGNQRTSLYAEQGAVLAASGGTVGIGTNSPGAKLDVNGTFRSLGRASFPVGLTSANLLVDGGATFGADIYAPNMVTGVNGITGAVSITSGSNITITQTGKQITIASSGGGSSPPLATSSITGVASFRAADFDVSITGSVSLTANVARTNIANTFTALQSFTAGLSAAGGLTFGSDLSVNGNINATTKSFVIAHPTKPGMTLRYGSLEGPENGVYVRGMLKNCDTIELPEYWLKLVDEDTITVNLTPIGSSNSHFVKSIGNNQVIVGSRSKKINCFYIVFGERKDVPKLTVEY